jgi:hypothetical protein
MESDSYKQAYGEEEVWKKFVRNYGGHIKPLWTRLRCIVRNLFFIFKQNII